MTGDWEREPFNLSHTELLSLYLILAEHEGQLDARQQEVLRRVCDHLYARLSVEQLEDIEKYYNSL